MYQMNSATESGELRKIEYLSPAAEVSMSDGYFQIAGTDHFWVRRRFHVLQHLAEDIVSGAAEIAEAGCGHGLLQRQIEDGYGKEVTGFDLNEYALKHNVSRISRVCCYDIHQRAEELRGKFDLILLFDVLEHIKDEDRFLHALLFHLAPQGKLILNVPAGQWAFSAYDVAAGHIRRYSIGTLRKTARRTGLGVKRWSYWGLPLAPALMARKLLVAMKENESEIYNAGFDSRTPWINRALGALSRFEWIPQKLLGTSLMAVVQPVSGGSDRGTP
jgi:SAM-dependent methyltransferase